jgi:hypothetical protein
MRNRRTQPEPLDLHIRVATVTQLCNRLGFPCIACGSPVDLGQLYCPHCRGQITLQSCRAAMRVEELERLLTAA